LLAWFMETASVLTLISWARRAELASRWNVGA
jgi:hypothetical protein